MSTNTFFTFALLFLISFQVSNVYSENVQDKIEKKKIDIITVFDRSGSMFGHIEDQIKQVEKFKNEQAKIASPDSTFTFISFNNIVDTPKTVKMGEPLDDSILDLKARGGTAMYDGIGAGINYANYFHKNNKENDISFISTGGGALLELIGNGSLPALDLLKK